VNLHQPANSKDTQVKRSLKHKKRLLVTGCLLLTRDQEPETRNKYGSSSKIEKLPDITTQNAFAR
jgi:hypothetical protein